MKKLKESWCPEGIRKGLTSYHLKNVLFWECEDHPRDNEWLEEDMTTRLSSMCDRLRTCIRDENLPQYFHPGVNLLSTKNKDVLYQARRHIEQFLRDLVSYLNNHFES